MHHLYLNKPQSKSTSKVVYVLWIELAPLDDPQILMANQRYNLYIFYRLFHLQVYTYKKMLYLPSFHGLNPAPPVIKIFFSIINSRSEEHTSELQSRPHLVCRLLLEKKKINSSVVEFIYLLYFD